MVKALLCCALLGVGLASTSGCDSGASTSVVAPPSDEAARLALEAEEAAYDKQLEAENQ